MLNKELLLLSAKESTFPIILRINCKYMSTANIKVRQVQFRESYSWDSVVIDLGEISTDSDSLIKLDIPSKYLNKTLVVFVDIYDYTSLSEEYPITQNGILDIYCNEIGV